MPDRGPSERTRRPKARWPFRLREGLGLERAVGPYRPAPRPDAPHVEIVYRRPGGRVERHRQELLHDGDEVKVTLLLRPPGARTLGGAGELAGGSALLWFTFPGRWHEVAAFHDARGRFLGTYTNLIRPPELSGSVWRIDDLLLDVWLAPRSPPAVLDEDEFQEARRRGRISEDDARRAEEECRSVLARVRRGDWPPDPVRRWPLESVPYLRLRRDAPGTYHAARLAGRVIGYGLYLLGAVSLTSLAFGVWLMLGGRGPGGTGWLATLAAEALILLPLALGGRLPATRWPRPAPTDERTFFLGALASGLAIFVLHDAAAWRGPLAGVYGALALFCLIFAVCRAWFDRKFPAYALAGLLVCALSLLALLA